MRRRRLGEEGGYDFDRTSVKLGLIHLGDDIFGGTAGAKGDESESAGAGSAANGSEGAKYFAEARFAGGWCGVVAGVCVDIVLNGERQFQ